jgi:molybdate transport system regulatory protein
MTRLTVRLDFEGERRLGPGKVALLEAIEATGSITAAAKALGMSYRRAWVLLEETNALFTSPVTDTAQGGRQGGGAALTSFGREVVARYRALEDALQRAARSDVRFLEEHLQPVRGSSR